MQLLQKLSKASKIIIKIWDFCLSQTTVGAIFTNCKANDPLCIAMGQLLYTCSILWGSIKDKKLNMYKKDES